MAAMETKKDYTSDLEAMIPESRIVAKERGMDEALQMLLGLEKKCRISNDNLTLKEVCLHMIRLVKESGDWVKLNSILSVINKRRSQSKLAVGAIVEEAFTYIEQCPTVDIKIELITTLKEICEGKIYVEGESAKLHLMLAKILEEKGDIAGACAMIQDVHVETYGALTKKEKAEYILEQIRLNLLNKDYIRSLIQSRKMNRKCKFH
jgi:26S proteasome regulatory subunit N5